MFQLLSLSFVLVDEFTDFDVLVVRAGHAFIQVCELFEDCLSRLVVIVVFDDTEV